MKSDEDLHITLGRKFVSAIYSSTLFSILFALIVPNPFNESITSIQHYFSDVISMIPIYQMYSLPIYIIYGIFTSFLSEKIANRIANRNNHLWLTFYVFFHLLFGLILFVPGLLAATIYFFIDLILLKQNRPLTTFQWINLFATPIVVWFLSMSFIWIHG